MAKSLVELLIEGAQRTDASKPAVLTDESALTYEQLFAGAQGIAATLAGAGIGRGARVAVWMDKTPACVQAILGVLLAGAAYVPLDPRAPWRRCRTILLDCGTACLIVDAPRFELVPSVIEESTTRMLLVDGRDDGPLAEYVRRSSLACERLVDAMNNPSIASNVPDSEDLAYILYTSGSTGMPKGVMHTHRSGLAFVRWVQRTFSITTNDVFSSHAPFHFDLSVSDLYASLGSGASVRLLSSMEAMLAPFLIRKVRECGITIWYSVPSILISMLDTGDLEERGFGQVRALLFAGEVFPTPQLRRLRRAVPAIRLTNLFGPTETNVCTYYDVPDDIPDDRTTPIPIGRRCEHLETFVMGDEGAEVGAGMEGTLWVKGDNLMEGYWNDSTRTAETLMADPRGQPGIAYCTGDRVRLNRNGDYEFLGRRDHMIKTRGYRVELGEIENAINSHPSVLETVAIGLPDERTGARIVASVVARQGGRLAPHILRAFCRERLPSYMIPEEFIVRSMLPRTSTGKVDRQALSAELKTQERL
jgi:amino acid adenylation domain-containing protein